MRYIIISILVLLTGSVLSAQKKCEKSEQLERLKAQKVAFITERVGLNSATAQKFWPIYNEFSSKKDSLVIRRTNVRTDLKENLDKLTLAQKESALDLQMQLRLDEARLDRHYHQKFKQVLTIDQLILLYEAEHEFRMRLIRQIREMNACKDGLSIDFQLLTSNL
jgi:hypothetical protein